MADRVISLLQELGPLSGQSGVNGRLPWPIVTCLTPSRHPDTGATG